MHACRGAGLLLPHRIPTFGGQGASGLPKVPEEEVADLAVGQGALQQELGQLAVQVRLVLEHLHQLQQVLEELVVPAGGRGGRMRGPWGGRRSEARLGACMALPRPPPALGRDRWEVAGRCGGRGQRGRGLGGRSHRDRTGWRSGRGLTEGRGLGDSSVGVMGQLGGVANGGEAWSIRARRWVWSQVGVVARRGVACQFGESRRGGTSGCGHQGRGFLWGRGQMEGRGRSGWRRGPGGSEVGAWPGKSTRWAWPVALVGGASDSLTSVSAGT